MSSYEKVSKNIVLLHGWRASTSKLEPLERSLLKTGWQVLNVKLPGFDSPTPKFPWNLDDYVNYVQKLVYSEFKNQPFIIFGHSFGGRIAIKLANRPQELLKGAVLCCSGGLSRPNSLKIKSFWLLSKLGKILLPLPPLANMYKKLLYKIAREHDYEKANEIMKGVLQKVVEEDLRPQLRNINLPSLILWGREDRITPFKDAQFAHSNIRNSTLIPFTNEGHKLPYNQPEAVAWEINKWFGNLN